MRHQQYPLAAPVPGTQRAVDVFEYGPDDAAGTVYIQASLHADELPGMLVAWQLKKWLQALDDKGVLKARVLVVPVANPIGLDQQLMDSPLGRYHLETLGNFNRGYRDVSQEVIAKAEGALGDDANANQRLVHQLIVDALAEQTASTEVESLKLILQQLASSAHYVLDLHCDFSAVEHLYTTPAGWQRFEPLARYFHSKASMLAVDSGGESFDECHTLVWERIRQHFGDSYPIPYGCASITLELRGQGDVNHDLAQQDATAILNWMRYSGLIDEAAPPLPELQHAATPLDAMDFLAAPIGGLLVFHARPGERLAQGALVAEIIDPLTDEVAEVRAPQAGMLYGRNERHMATKGMIVADLAGTHRHRSGYLLAP